MIPASFDYEVATSAQHALELLASTARTPSCWPAATPCCR